MSGDHGSGMVLVCWLNAQQQRIEELQQRPLDDDDAMPLLDGPSPDLWASEESRPPEGPKARRRRVEEDEAPTG